MKTIHSIDDDYLIGMSNKGTLKRAYKDLESAEVSAEYGEDSVQVKLSGEVCTIVNPLGESKCSCPSRSVCRHLITAILWIKSHGDKEENTENNASDDDELKELSTKLIDELSSYSPEALQKAMKKTYYTALKLHYKNGTLPELEETSIVSVKFPWENTSVRLISPLEFSTCTCHSKELCKHKAAAILVWQIKHGKATLDEPKAVEEKTVKTNVEEIHSVAEYVKDFLVKLLSDGLVRASDNLVEETELAAVMCHNERLADCERGLREIGNRLKGYIQHSPEFSSMVLFSMIMDNLILLRRIISTDNEERLSDYLGEFKTTYVGADTLELLPIAKRHFVSEAGYEGDIFYFVNLDKKSEPRFLTYSAVRPNFYGTSRRTVSPAPWGLFGSVDELLKTQIILYSPKLSGSKLSSSNDTKGDIVKAANLNQPIVIDMIYGSFARMLSDIFRYRNDDSTDERLVFIAPRKCVYSKSNEITQTHYIVVEDFEGKRLTVKLRYKSESKMFFKRFSQIGDIMQTHPEKQFVIFGNAYLENGKCYIYPIAIFDNIEYNYTIDNNIESAVDDSAKYYRYFAELFNNIKHMMCDIIQCGINSFDLYEQIKEYSEESGKMGMLMLSQKLDELYTMLLARNHTYSTDNSNITAVLSDIFEYIQLGSKHTEYSLALENLNKGVVKE